MWFQIDPEELKMVTTALQRRADQLNGGMPGHVEAEKHLDLAQRLLKQPDPQADAFRNAVATDDELEVDPDAVVSPGDEGAFVMSWSWVSNDQAGIKEDDINGKTD